MRFRTLLLVSLMLPWLPSCYRCRCDSSPPSGIHVRMSEGKQTENERRIMPDVEGGRWPGWGTCQVFITCYSLALCTERNAFLTGFKRKMFVFLIKVHVVEHFSLLVCVQLRKRNCAVVWEYIFFILSQVCFIYSKTTMQRPQDIDHD